MADHRAFELGRECERRRIVSMLESIAQIAQQKSTSPAIGVAERITLVAAQRTLLAAIGKINEPPIRVEVVEQKPVEDPTL